MLKIGLQKANYIDKIYPYTSLVDFIDSILLKVIAYFNTLTQNIKIHNILFEMFQQNHLTLE